MAAFTHHADFYRRRQLGRDNLLESLINLRLPAYVAAVMGGIVGVPVWELLRRVQPKS